MWHWDQGHQAYFHFDALRSLSKLVIATDFKSVTRAQAQAITGLPFAAPPTHSPWRNYSRALKLCLLVSEQGSLAVPTPVAQILARPGEVTSDEYFHFLVQSSTEPNPALQGWQPTSPRRYPLLFSLKYLLAKAAISKQGNPPATASLDEIIGAYRASGFSGAETDEKFIDLFSKASLFAPQGASAPDNLRRQARESLKTICQISYLHLNNNVVVISLNPADALDIFQSLNPIISSGHKTADEEIRAIAKLFSGGTTDDFFEYPNTVMNEVIESGFNEGSKVKKTHVTIERNSGLRAAFFARNDTTVCDVCRLDTAASYPWTSRVLDLHHLLPLCSGTRIDGSSTTLSDLVPLCPSCHRGVHRYYDDWFRKMKRKDFASRDEAVGVYDLMKTEYPGPCHV